MRCEVPFVIFCTGQAIYFWQQDVDKVLSYRRRGKRMQEDAILEKMWGGTVSNINNQKFKDVGFE